MRQMMKRLKNEKGLTLVELLAVVVILAIVSAIAFVMIGNVMENAKKDAAVADAMQVISAAKLYEVSESIEGGDIEVTVPTLLTDGYLDTLYDPWTKDGYGTEASNKVEKGDAGYKVNLNASKCKLTDVAESKLIKNGRKECD